MLDVFIGNKPPWTLPAKAAYFSHDTPRALKYFGLKFTIPDFFPILSLVVRFQGFRYGLDPAGLC